MRDSLRSSACGVAAVAEVGVGDAIVYVDVNTDMSIAVQVDRVLAASLSKQHASDWTLLDVHYPGDVAEYVANTMESLRDEGDEL